MCSRITRSILMMGIALGLMWSSASAVELAVGGQLGYTGAPGAEATVSFSDFAVGFPLEARFALGWSTPDPGDPLAARRIFINNATNGVPEESGRAWSYRMDFIYEMSGGPMPGLRVYGGPRYARFTGNFRFIGGNEDFDVISREWGVGMGAEQSFAMGATTNLVLGAGFDYFPKGELGGHDTSYAPDGEDVNAREDYEYDDADEAIDQPHFDLRVMLGVNYRFGG